MEQRFAIFLPSFAKGGVERMMVNLACGFAAIGHSPDFVVKEASSPYLRTLPETVKLIELDSIHPDIQVAAALYLEQASPYAILTSKDENDAVAVKAKERSRTDTRIIMRAPVHVTSRLKHKQRGKIKTWMTYMKLKKVLVKADSIIAVSNGVAADISHITGIPLDKIHVIRNPVITPELENLASADIDHKWLTQKDKPVLLGIGRLGRQKNFELLIHAFNIVRTEIDCRLLILGEGRRRTHLERLVKRLGMTDSVELSGFVGNPFAYLAKADLFVLSSLWEGSPNALTEALALGVPVVSTDCESGPREILQDGRIGSLVPIGDVGKFAQTIIDTLTNPPPNDLLTSAVADYTIEKATRSYLEILKPPLRI